MLVLSVEIFSNNTGKVSRGHGRTDLSICQWSRSRSRSQRLVACPLAPLSSSLSKISIL